MNSLYIYESKYSKSGFSIGSLYYPVGIQSSNYIEAEFSLLKSAGNTIVEKFIFNQTFNLTNSSAYTR